MAFSLLMTGVRPADADENPDIRDLSEHFTKASDKPDFDAWMFAPAENVGRVTTAEHPGLAAVYPKGNGPDVKGMLKKPIRIDDYRLPWQFQCSYMQNFDALTGRTPSQANYAIGLNVAVTFSDPSTWPIDRTQLPDQTQSIQLLVAHLGNYGEVGKGLPQLLSETNLTPETYLVWGRGEAAGPAGGDWKIPTILIGDGARYGGPSSNQLYFRATIESPTHISVGIKFDASHGWNIRHIDLSKYGKITGIWEIGPIISCDRWLPDVLAPQLGIKPPPEVLPPATELATFVDYCVFLGADPMPLEHLSDEFNIPGYMGQWQIQEQGTIVETYSHPGNLAVHLLGPGMGTCFGHAGVINLSLKDYPPPWEIELAVRTPPKEYPWNFYYNFGIYSDDYDDPHWMKLIGRPAPANPGKLLGWWTPGILNSKKGGLQPHPTKAEKGINVEWETPVPEEILASQPVYMLLQVIDANHLRMGFRSDPAKPWHLSKICDTSVVLGAPMGQLGPHHAISLTTSPQWGGEYGLPTHQMFLFDYIRYRYGLSEQ